MNGRLIFIFAGKRTPFCENPTNPILGGCFDHDERKIAPRDAREACSVHLAKNVLGVTRIDRRRSHPHEDFAPTGLRGLDGRGFRTSGMLPRFSKRSP